MKLEEAIIFLMKIAKEYKTYGDLDNPEFEDIKKIPKAIQIVLKALKDKDKEIYKLDKKFQYAIPDDIVDDLYVSKEKIENYKNKFIKESKKEKVFMTQSTQINASLISFCEKLLEDK